MFKISLFTQIGVFAFVVAVLSLVGCVRDALPTAGGSPSNPMNNAISIHYSITILSGLGGTASSGDGINDLDWITGWATLHGSANPEHEVLWTNQRRVDFGTLGGPSSDSAFPKKGDAPDVPGLSETAIKDPLGEDFCYFGTGYTCLGIYWRDGKLHALPRLGGNNSIALGNNDRGEIVGVSETNTRGKCEAPQVLDYEAVLWTPGSHHIQELPPLAGDRLGVATAINDSGKIVGGSGPRCAILTPQLSTHPLLWEGGKPVELPTLGGRMNNVAWAINRRGDISGMSDVSGDATMHAVLWHDHRITDLGTLPGDFSSIASGMNDKGQIAGVSCDKKGNCRGFLWQNGVMMDINTLIPSHSHYYVITANDINDRGIIVGETYDTTTHATPAFKAIPRAGPFVLGDGTRVTLPQSVRMRLEQRRGFGAHPFSGAK